MGFYWAKASYTKINARAEGVFDSKMFAQSARRQRCLVVADGFYEPLGDKSSKYRPWFYFCYPDHRPFVFACIWTYYSDAETSFNNFAILTQNANHQVSPIHDRMPVILNHDHAQWLDTNIHKKAKRKTDQAA